MCLKNKIISLAFCAIVAVAGVFAIGNNSVQAQTASGTTVATAGMSIEQLQQIVNSLIAQIQQIIALISQLRPLETCGNGICRFGETAATCPADCKQTADELIPSQADVPACTSSTGQSFKTTGNGNYAKWFIWNDCAREKTYSFDLDSELNKVLIFNVYGDTCATCQCKYPNFEVYEERDGAWLKIASVNLSESTPRFFIHAPGSNKIKIKALNCFYMRVFYGYDKSVRQQFPAWEKLPLIDHAICGNNFCDTGETAATCAADCNTTACVKRGEIIDPNGTKKCCNGLMPLDGCFVDGIGPDGYMGCSQKPYRCGTLCGNGKCETGMNETAANCPADCGQTSNCAMEGEKIETCKDVYCPPFPTTVKTKCCPGLFPQTKNSYLNGNYCEVTGMGSDVNTYVCVKTVCGNGVCDTGENECNCKSDCATTPACREDLGAEYCEKNGGRSYAGNGWASCSCPQKKCQSDRDCLNYPAAASYCKFENGACSGTGVCARIWSATQMGSTAWEPTLCGCNGQSYANAYELQKSGISLKQLGGCSAAKQCASEGEYANLGGSIEQRYGCCIPPKNNTYLQGFQTGKGMLCYNAANGSPVCLNQGTPKEGWYHKYTPEVPILIEPCAN